VAGALRHSGSLEIIVTGNKKLFNFG